MRRTAAELFLDEGVVADALRRWLRRGGAAEEPAAPAAGTSVRRADRALQRAGRQLIAAVRQDPDFLAQITAAVPLDAFPDEFFGTIFRTVAAQIAAGGVIDADFIAAQPAEESAEITRALVEEPPTPEARAGALTVFRRAYLTAALAQHTHRAETMMQEGKAGYVDELNEVKRIQDELAQK